MPRGVYDRSKSRAASVKGDSKPVARRTRRRRSRKAKAAVAFAEPVAEHDPLAELIAEVVKLGLAAYRNR